MLTALPSFSTTATRPVSPHPSPKHCCSGYAAGSYQQVCGEGHETEGDAVVPLRSALLEGADHVMLDGVFHRWAQAGRDRGRETATWEPPRRRGSGRQAGRQAGRQGAAPLLPASNQGGMPHVALQRELRARRAGWASAGPHQPALSIAPLPTLLQHEPRADLQRALWAALVR